MKHTQILLTERHPPCPDQASRAVIQRSVTAWLVKALRK